jgi:hypothetical protein
MHGGKATGAPKENRNAWKYGNYSEQTKLWHARVAWPAKAAEKGLYSTTRLSLDFSFRSP